MALRVKPGGGGCLTKWQMLASGHCFLRQYRDVGRTGPRDNRLATRIECIIWPASNYLKQVWLVIHVSAPQTMARIHWAVTAIITSSPHSLVKT